MGATRTPDTGNARNTGQAKQRRDAGPADQRIILFWTWPWRTRGLLAAGAMNACRVMMHREPGVKMLH
jgi:hypothetical protein